jgi:hypothetical protein
MATAEASAPVKKAAPRTPEKPYYRALRPLTFNGKKYRKGQVVPGVGALMRPEALVRARRVELVE